MKCANNKKEGFFYQFIKRIDIDIKRINPFLIDIDTIRKILENIFSIWFGEWK